MATFNVAGIAGPVGSTGEGIRPMAKQLTAAMPFYRDSLVDGANAGTTDAMRLEIPGYLTAFGLDAKPPRACAAAPVTAAQGTRTAAGWQFRPSVRRPNPHLLLVPWGVQDCGSVGSGEPSIMRSRRLYEVRYRGHHQAAMATAVVGFRQLPTAPRASPAHVQCKADRVFLMVPASWNFASAAVPSEPTDRSAPVLPPAGVASPHVMSSRSPAALRFAPFPRALRTLFRLAVWRRAILAALRQINGLILAVAATARMPPWWRWERPGRRRAATAVAWGSMVGAMLLPGFGLPHVPRVAMHASRPVMPATGPVSVEVNALPAVALPPVSGEAAVAATVPAGSRANEPLRKDAAATLLSEVSTMDLMMPIAEPDLDIASRHSLWAQIGKSSGIDPLLLYSVALVESKALLPNGKIAPTPWLFRVNDHLVRGDRRHVQLEMAAATQFGSAVQDVGIMQVYYPMHRDAVRDPLTLLNPRTNITVAAKILRKGMHQTHDRVLGVGYYHSHTPRLARDYGTAVLTVYQRLKGVYRSGTDARIATPAGGAGRPGEGRSALDAAEALHGATDARM